MGRKQKKGRPPLKPVFRRNGEGSPGKTTRKKSLQQTDALEVLSTPWTNTIPVRPRKGRPAHAIITWPDETQSTIDHNQLLFFLHASGERLDELKEQAIEYVGQHDTRGQIKRDNIRALINERFREMRRIAGIVSEYARSHVAYDAHAHNIKSIRTANAGGKKRNLRV